MSMAIEPLRGLCIRAITDLRQRVSFQDGETADRLRGPEGEKRIARLVAVLLAELADHELELAPDDRMSHTLKAVRRAMPRLRGA
jgi:hypothetical protein